MNKIENEVSTVTATEPSTSYANAAQERVLELRRWREQIPHFATPATTDATKRLSSAASVPPEFIELTNLALANHMALVRAEGATPAQVRTLRGRGAVAHELRERLQLVGDGTERVRARNAAGSEALTTYSLATRLAKRPATAYLAPYVADMRRALGRGRKPSLEALAQKATERAQKAVARVARKGAPVAVAEPDTKPQA